MELVEENIKENQKNKNNILNQSSDRKFQKITELYKNSDKNEKKEENENKHKLSNKMNPIQKKNKNINLNDNSSGCNVVGNSLNNNYSQKIFEISHNYLFKILFYISFILILILATIIIILISVISDKKKIIYDLQNKLINNECNKKIKNITINNFPK